MSKILKYALCVLILTVTITSSGCSLFLETFLNNLYDKNLPRDGRAHDASGLTDRDKTARWEEKRFRNMDRDRRNSKGTEGPDAKTSFYKDWENHLQRNR